MNRYELEGITFDLINGLRIIICARRNHARIIFNDVLDRLQDNGFTPDRVNRTNGMERIDLTPGSLSFAHTSDALRGRQADLVLFSTAIREQPSFLDTWHVEAVLVTQHSVITKHQPHHRLNKAIEQISG